MATLRKGDRFHQDGGLTDEECAALPPSWGDEELPPGPWVPDAEERKIGDWLHAPAVGRNGRFELHPDTDPVAIRAAQRADVLAAAARLRGELGREPTAAEVGANVVLPTWNVERVLREDGGS